MSFKIKYSKSSKWGKYIKKVEGGVLLIGKITMWLFLISNDTNQETVELQVLANGHPTDIHTYLYFLLSHRSE